MLVKRKAPALDRLMLGAVVCTLHSTERSTQQTRLVCARASCSSNRRESKPTADRSRKILASSTPSPGQPQTAVDKQGRKLPSSWSSSGKGNAHTQKAHQAKPIVINDEEIEEIDSDEDESSTQATFSKRYVSGPHSQQWNGFMRHKSFSFAIMPKSSLPLTKEEKAPQPNAIIMDRGRVPLLVPCLRTSSFHLVVLVQSTVRQTRHSSAGCGEAKYCSVECEKEAWKGDHRSHCPSVLFTQLIKVRTALPLTEPL